MQPSCPGCGAPAKAHANACAGCGYRFVQHAHRAPHSGRRRWRIRAGVSAAVVIAGAGCAAWLVGRDPQQAAPADRVPTTPDVLSSHPRSTGGVEHLLEARFASPRPGDSAVARCSALQPRPAHAIRRCRIRHPGGEVSAVVVLTNPQGREVLVDP